MQHLIARPSHFPTEKLLINKFPMWGTGPNFRVLKKLTITPKLGMINLQSRCLELQPSKIAKQLQFKQRRGQLIHATYLATYYAENDFHFNTYAMTFGVSTV